MPTPVITFSDYVFCFDAEPEQESSKTHFIGFCGWTPQQFARIRNYPFFCAKVSCWKDGEELSTDYLGACCYKTESAFYKTYRGDYFADMVRTCADETGDTELIAQVDAWHAKLRAQTENRIAAKQAKRAAKQGAQA